ncbi:MAG: hypothetical protein WAW88_02400 [Nocardioides sp.]
MTRSRVLLGLVAAWVLVVLVGSTVVWAVISRAGDNFSPTGGAQIQAPTPSATDLPTAPPVATVAPQQSPIRLSPTPTPTPPPAPVTPTPSAPPSPPASSPSEHQHTPGTQQPGSGGGQSVRRTWQGTGGTILAECRGFELNVSVISDPGFHAEVDQEYRHAVVKFEGTGEDHAETSVLVGCRSGVPIFFARTEGDDE